MLVLQSHWQYSNAEDFTFTFTQRCLQWNKYVRICAMRTPKTLKLWAWQSLPLSNLELPHNYSAIHLATISCKLQPEFRQFYSQLCKHKPIYVLSTWAWEEGVQSCLYIVHYLYACCSAQVWMHWTKACGEQGWGYLLSWLLLPHSYAHTRWLSEHRQERKWFRTSWRST